MDQVQAMRVYVRVAELGSFTAAADNLGLLKATVSNAVRQLENELRTRLPGYAAMTLLQLGDWLQQLDQRPAALECWQHCAQRHSAVTGVPEQLAARLPDYDIRAMQQPVRQGREAVALQLTGQPEQAAGLFAHALQQAPALIGLNMAAARLYAAQAATDHDGQARTLLQACLQRIGQLSPLEPEAREFSRMTNPLEVRPW